jgi:hypothetical protein
VKLGWISKDERYYISIFCGCPCRLEIAHFLP